MHSQTCPSITKSVIEAILRKRNAKIRSKPETKISGIFCVLESGICWGRIRNPAHKDVIRMSRNAFPLRPPPPVLTSFVIYYWKTHRNLFDEWKWVLRYSFGPGKSSCFRERDSLLGFLYSFRTWDLAGESTLLPPAVPQKGTLIIIFCLFVFF